MIIRKTETKDIKALMTIFEEARRTIAALGINQWQNGYPAEADIIEDIDLDQGYCVEIGDGTGTDGEVCGTFALIRDGEPTYHEIYEGKWLTGDTRTDYLAIHRVAISVKNRGSGISGEIIAFAAGEAIKAGKRSLRIDTHEGNKVMRRMLEKNGFVHCGTIYLKSGDPRVAYEKLL